MGAGRRPAGAGWWAVRLAVVPCTQRQAAKFVAQMHRHHRPSRGAKFCLAVMDETGAVRGVAMVGRPVARGLDDGLCAEVTRVATDGCPNACSALLGAARRVAFAQGYLQIVTYTLPEEGGASLRGAGWTVDGETVGDRGWTCEKYKHLKRSDDHPLQSKIRWVSRNRKAPKLKPIWPELTQNDAQTTLFGGSHER